MQLAFISKIDSLIGQIDGCFKHILHSVLSACPAELALLGKKTEPDDLLSLLKQAPIIMTYSEAVRRFFYPDRLPKEQ